MGPVGHDTRHQALCKGRASQNLAQSVGSCSRNTSQAGHTNILHTS